MLKNLSLHFLTDLGELKAGLLQFAFNPWRGLRMITVSQEQLDTVEYLISQSAQGNHILFDLDLGYA